MPPEGTDLSRRDMLAVLGALVSTAGCSGNDDDEPDDDPDDTEPDDTPNDEPTDEPEDEPDNDEPDDDTDDSGDDDDTGPGDDPENGGEDGLVEAVSILDGEDDIEDEFVMGFQRPLENELDLQIYAEGSGNANYSVELVDGSEIPEDLAEEFYHEGELKLGEEFHVDTIEWSDVGPEIEGDHEAQLQVEVYNEETGSQESVEIPVKVYDDTVRIIEEYADFDLEEMFETNLERREAALEGMRINDAEEEYRGYFRDFENIRKIYNHFGIDMEPITENAAIYYFRDELDFLPEEFSTEDRVFEYFDASYSAPVTVNPNVRKMVVDKDLPEVNEDFMANEVPLIFKSKQNVITRITGFDEVPERYEEFKDGEVPSMAANNSPEDYREFLFDDSEFWNNTLLIWNKGIITGTGRKQAIQPSGYREGVDTLEVRPDGEIRGGLYALDEKGDDWRRVVDYNLSIEDLPGYHPDQ